MARKPVESKPLLPAGLVRSIELPRKNRGHLTSARESLRPVCSGEMLDYMRWLVTIALLSLAQIRAPGAGQFDPALTSYFKDQTLRIASNSLGQVVAQAEWQSYLGISRIQLQEMLGLLPFPERSDLHAVVTGTAEHQGVVVEKLHFQAMPKLYVTANLYRPKENAGSLPAILYACGHSRAITNGTSFGNKTGYQHHGAWFASNGYVCLMIDTLELGEIRGQHRGTYSDAQWWWNSRGYTPAGVETWFGIRALDYLCSRPEVDTNRIGMTGRSGGGAYTWMVAALDERIKVAAPIAGITDLHNHVIDGVVDGHCDCMFFVNTYRWDYSRLAELLAPRPLLIGNTDKDGIFPLEGVARIHSQTRTVYEMLKAQDKLGLLITEGPHEDTQDLQVPVFRWFNRWLKKDGAPLDTAARKLFRPEELRVFKQVPADLINKDIARVFVPTNRIKMSPEDLQETLRSKVFGAWPEDSTIPILTLQKASRKNGFLLKEYSLTTQPHVSLELQVLTAAETPRVKEVVVQILDDSTTSASPTAESMLNAAKLLQENTTALVYFKPRGIGQWTGTAAEASKARRRFMLLGQTLDGMRVWDIRSAIRGLRLLPELAESRITLRATGGMAVNAAYASLFEPSIAALKLDSVPQSHHSGPDYLNVLRFTDIPRVLEILRTRLDVMMDVDGKTSPP